MLEWYAHPRYQPFTMAHEDQDGNRPGILMIHGFTGTPDEMRPAATIAYEAGFDVDVMGLPGMGADIGSFRTVGRDDWLRATTARWGDLTERYQRRAVVGYSLGAALAIHASTAHAADAMVLLSPLIRLADPRAVALPLVQHIRKELAPFSDLDFTQPDVVDFFSRAIPELELDRADVQEAIRTEFVMPTRLLNECRLIGREAGRQAGSITVPVTIIQGRPDTIVGHDNARWLVDHLGGSVTYHEIAGDHLVPFVAAPSWNLVKQLLTATFEHMFEEMSG